MATENNNLLDFQDPGALPKELMDVPGFVNELKNHTLAVAPRPNEPLAFAGALAMLAHLSGRSYVDERGSHTNLYLAALAPTAMGKEEPRDTNKALACAAGILASVPDTIASGEGLEDAVAASPSLLLQTDEADALLTAMRGSDSRAAKLNEMVLRFFSETKSGHAMRIKAGEARARRSADEFGRSREAAFRVRSAHGRRALLPTLREGGEARDAACDLGGPRPTRDERGIGPLGRTPRHAHHPQDAL